MVEEPVEIPMLWYLPVQPYMGKLHRGLKPLHLHAWKLSNDSHKVQFCDGVAEYVTTDVRISTACLYQGGWYKFLHWCCGRNYVPFETTVQQIPLFFLYLCKELRVVVVRYLRLRTTDPSLIMSLL